jgi:hypothetical protein
MFSNFFEMSLLEKLRLTLANAPTPRVRFKI